jgi:hypothetical protein
MAGKLHKIPQSLRLLEPAKMKLWSGNPSYESEIIFRYHCQPKKKGGALTKEMN